MSEELYVKNLFSSGEPGAWWDPSDMSTLFEDSAGTIPITTVEKPVGLMLDKRMGLVLGPELVTNGTFDTNINGWTAGSAASNISWVSGKLRVSTTIAESQGKSAYQAFPVISGKTYKISCGVTLVNGSFTTVQLALRNGADAASSTLIAGSDISSTDGEKSFIYTATATTTLYLHCRIFNTSATATVDYDNITAKELPGNHATQSTAANRPVLSARYNLLTATNNISTFTPTNAVISGSIFTVSTPGTANVSRVISVGSQANNTLHTFSVKIKKVNVDWVYVQVYNINATFAVNAYVNLGTGQIGSSNANSLGGTASLVAIQGESNSYRLFLSVVSTHAFTAPHIFIRGASGNGNLTCTGGESYDVSEFDLRVTNEGANLPPYQRVGSLVGDYDTTAFPMYLRFNGTNSWMQTNSINFTSTDKMTVWAGVRKLSDATFPVIVESFNGSTWASFSVHSSVSSSLTGYAVGIGTSNAAFWSGRTTNKNAPNSSVLTYIADSDAGNFSSAMRLNVNGAQETLTDASGGINTKTKFANNPLYIGARAGSSLWLNGRIYSLIVRGAQSSTEQIIATEKYVQQKTPI
jgi:hypothetical protein